MQYWDLKKTYHQQLFNLFMKKFSHLILAKPESKSNQIYIDMEQKLGKSI